MITYGPLYARASTGKIKMWTAVATEQGTLEIMHGYKDGKKTSSIKEIHSKNKGRSNETSPFEQACSEAQSKMNKKMDEGYVANQEDLENQVLLLPMLAHLYGKRKHDIVWPAYVQPKLNGVRCLASKGEYLSRKGKQYTTLSHLDDDVKAIQNAGIDCPLDGEIFHPDWTFQEIIRAVKKDRGEITDELQYWVYDIVDPKSNFEQRTNIIQSKFSNECKKIKGILFDSTKLYHIGNVIYVPTIMVRSENEMLSWHNKFIKDGFEGTIIRNRLGKYELKNRSKNLQKYKDFLDGEYKIVGGEEASGNDKGTVVFICKIPGTTERTFSVRPKGSRETRSKWFTELDSIIGKQLTVRYQELSEDGIPIFPVGLAIRDYEG